MQALHSISGHCFFSGRIFRNNWRQLSLYTKPPAAVHFDFISLNTRQVFFNSKAFLDLSGCILDCRFVHTNEEWMFWKLFIKVIDHPKSLDISRSWASLLLARQIRAVSDWWIIQIKLKMTKKCCVILKHHVSKRLLYIWDSVDWHHYQWIKTNRGFDTNCDSSPMPVIERHLL